VEGARLTARTVLGNLEALVVVVGTPVVAAVGSKAAVVVGQITGTVATGEAEVIGRAQRRPPLRTTGEVTAELSPSPHGAVQLVHGLAEMVKLVIGPHESHPSQNADLLQAVQANV